MKKKNSIFTRHNSSVRNRVCKHNLSVRIEDATAKKSIAGITLISLVITIVLMLIIASTVTISGIDAVRTSKRTSFITELEMIKEKVNVIYEKRKANSNDITYYDSLGQDISVLSQTKLDEILKGASQEGYRYFSKDDLKQLDLDNISQDVIINYDNKDIVSVIGIEIDGIRYYRLTDIPTYNGYNVEYINKNDKAPTFDVEIQELSNSWRFNIKRITYTSNVSGGSVSYKLHDSQNWILAGEQTYFEVYTPGLYDIKLTDKAGNETIVQEYVYVTYGLVAQYDGENNTGSGHDDTATIWKDLSGNGNDAILQNFSYTEGSQWQSDSLLFDGVDDYAVISNPQNIPEGSSPYTIEVVFKSKQKNKDAGLVNIGIYNTANQANAFRIQKYNGFRNYYWDNDLDTPEGILSVEKKYTAVALNYGMDRRIYVNTELKAQDNATPNTTMGEITIGVTCKEYNEYFDSNIYAIRVYNRGLTEKEISINYQIDNYRFNISE